ncbi:MAG: c-type cytochrome biogenesis protein CcmI [Oceanospirillaceae bacterium]
MIELWLGIILLTLVALSFICWPLFGLVKANQSAVGVNRQQENISIFEQRLAELQKELQQNLLNEESFAELKLELEKNLLIDASLEDSKLKILTKVTKPQMIMVVVICFSLPMFSLGLYAKYGSSDDLLWAENKNSSHQLAEGEKPTAEQAITLLEEELVREPNNAEGWYMLAGIYMGTNQFDKGADAFAKVLEVLPEESPQFPSVVGQYAQSIFFIEGKVSKKVQAQISRALALDADEVVSLGLLGIAAFETNEYQLAIDYWNHALQNAELNAAQALKSGISKAEQRLIDSGVDIKKSEITKLNVIVDVEISDTLKAQLDSDAVLFVFARPVGGRIPLAAVKMKVSDLPKRVILDDSLAMMANAKISLQKKVEVSARISISGQPQSQKGDFESAVLVLDVIENSSSVKLLINKVVE